LFYIGYQLERVLGSRWFLAIYLCAGIAGNISSSIFTMAMSAGASGALFGLLGSGYFLERSIGGHIESLTGHRPRRRIYSGMVFINILLGAIIPGIDNAAHIGGLIVGAGMTFIMVNVRPNRLQAVNTARAFFAGLVLILAAGVGASIGTSKAYVASRLEAAGDDAESLPRSYHFYSEVLRVSPMHSQVLLKRARILLMNGDEEAGLDDVKRAAADPAAGPGIRRLADELRAAGYFDTAEEVKAILSQDPTQNL